MSWTGSCASSTGSDTDEGEREEGVGKNEKEATTFLRHQNKLVEYTYNLFTLFSLNSLNFFSSFKANKLFSLIVSWFYSKN